MPPTFEDLARRAQGKTNFPIPLPIAVQWASDRVQELLGTRRTAILRRNLELSIPGAFGQGVPGQTSGTVTVSRGSKSILGDASAQALWLTIDASFPIGWFIKIKTAWYRVAGKDATHIFLESSYAGDDVVAASYLLVKRHHMLPDNVYQLEELSFVHARTGLSLAFLNNTILTNYYPLRWAGLGMPRSVCEVEPGPGDVRQIEVYPSPAENELISYDAFVIRDQFTYADTLPVGIDIQHVMPGLLADFYGWAMAQEDLPAEQRQLAMNEKARELTRWEGSKQAALMRLESNTIKGIILISPISRHRGQWNPHTITTAYDHVWSR